MVSTIKRISMIIKKFIDLIVDTLVGTLSYIVSAIENLLTSILSFCISIAKRLPSGFIRFAKPLHKRLGYYFPKFSRSRMNRMIVYTGLTRNPEEVLGIALIYSIVLSIMTVLLAIALKPSIRNYVGVELDYIFIIILAAILPFILVWVVLYLFFIVLIERRTSSIEKVLPDVLNMIGQNMIAGMTTYNALWVAARPEFGPLSIEIQTVARDTLGGESFENALIRMSERIKSYRLARSVKLMIQGMRSGGELPSVLQEIAEDIRVEQNLFGRMKSETTSQSLFIIFVLLIGAPLLFAASHQFIVIFNNIFSQIGISGSTPALPQEGVLISISELPIKSEFFQLYSLIVLGISGLFGAIMIGLIRTGKLSAGIPLVPILTPLPMIIFVVIDKLLESLFTGMIGL